MVRPPIIWPAFSRTRSHFCRWRVAPSPFEAFRENVDLRRRDSILSRTKVTTPSRLRPRYRRTKRRRFDMLKRSVRIVEPWPIAQAELASCAPTTWTFRSCRLTKACAHARVGSLTLTHEKKKEDRASEDGCLSRSKVESQKMGSSAKLIQSTSRRRACGR